MSRVDEDYTNWLNAEQEREVAEPSAYTEAERQAIAALILWQSGIIQQ